jgi:hypothetical protein
MRRISTGWRMRKVRARSKRGLRRSAAAAADLRFSMSRGLRAGMSEKDTRREAAMAEAMTMARGR